MCHCSVCSVSCKCAASTHSLMPSPTHQLYWFHVILNFVLCTDHVLILFVCQSKVCSVLILKYKWCLCLSFNLDFSSSEIWTQKYITVIFLNGFISTCDLYSYTWILNVIHLFGCCTSNFMEEKKVICCYLKTLRGRTRHLSVFWLWEKYSNQQQHV